MARPASRRTVACSSAIQRIAIGSVNNGTVAFQMPASTLDTCSSPYANNVNGATFSRSAAIASCPHTRSPAGGRSPRSARIASKVTVPTSNRQSETCSGASASSPILMNRNVEPQNSASNVNRAGHGVDV